MTSSASRPAVPAGPASILVVTPDGAEASVVSRALIGADHHVSIVSSETAGVAKLTELVPDVVVLDLALAAGPGRLLERLEGSVPVILLADRADDPRLSEALSGGAYDYLLRPLDERKLLIVTRHAAARRRLELRLASLDRESRSEGYPGITGRSEAMKRLFRQLDRIARSDATVLIHGASGTGKELIARSVHDHSGRRGAFVAVNCSAIPVTLEESELFGHERGAFTGAHARHIGKFEQAAGGTIFLDEVAELGLGLQAKLLRVLQERQFHRVGGTELVDSDFRLIAATHRDLDKEVAAGRFREDLYFRVAVVELEVPPLSEREGDVVLLAYQFLARYDDGGERDLAFGLDALAALVSYRWPGNVRELQNAVERGAVMTETREIGLADLPGRIREAVAAPESTSEGPAVDADECDVTLRAGQTLEDIEQLVIEAAFRRTGGVVTEMSQQLGIGRTALYRKLKRYALTRGSRS